MSEVVKVTTTRFGILEIAKDALIEINPGLIGFPNFRTFFLLDYTPPFSWLQSTEAPDLAFVVVNAAEFGEEYSFNLPYDDRTLELSETDDVAVLNLVSIRPDPTLSTVNLKAPVVVNLRNRRGKQIILDDPRFPTRMALYAPKEGDEKPE